MIAVIRHGRATTLPCLITYTAIIGIGTTGRQCVASCCESPACRHGDNIARAGRRQRECAPSVNSFPEAINLDLLQLEAGYD
ncbi:hypothetical protein GDO78_020949 [Eleutherodactylus coqui]|uniref:Uncharacterized protein n=1 Tax=Eleutherodactylus coqui TaxID=57060 RepID=A0A8J6B9L3_ELECQ|nr:hypothetical protein GDO78_020949 [Eleutherodactylus coqui]